MVDEILNYKTTQDMSKQISAETYELGHIFTLITEALLRAEVLMNEKRVMPKARHWIKTSIVNRLEFIKRDIVSILDNEAAQEMKKDMLNVETALQLREYTNMFLSLSQADRDSVETFMEQLKANELTDKTKAA